MTLPIQNPDASQAIAEVFDVVGRIVPKVDETISPIAIIADGWVRVTYVEFDLTVAASTAGAIRVLVPADPNFHFQLLFLEVRGTGNLTGEVRIEAGRVGGGADIRWNVFALDGIADPEIVTDIELKNGLSPVVPAGMQWQVRAPTTGVGETFRIKATLAQIPRTMRPPPE